MGNNTVTYKHNVPPETDERTGISIL